MWLKFVKFTLIFALKFPLTFEPSGGKANADETINKYGNNLFIDNNGGISQRSLVMDILLKLIES
jgi:hypothetical protein